MTNLKINHEGGFFSCCSVKLDNIVQFLNNNKRLPDVVDSSGLFDMYKNSNDTDVTHEYFSDNEKCIEYTDHINFKNKTQYKNYKDINYSLLSPLVKKYFTPSDEINKIICFIENKYKINYKNTCVLFYRGNDKKTETELCEYIDMLKMAHGIKSKNPGIKFLIQSDETQFILMMQSMLQNSFYFKDEIRHMNKCNGTVDKVFPNPKKFSKYYLAITIIMSKCKHVICNSSGNCSMWIALYRENANNFTQYLNGKFV